MASNKLIRNPLDIEIDGLIDMWETLSKLAIAIGGQIAIMLGIAGIRGLAKRALLADSLCTW